MFSDWPRITIWHNPYLVNLMVAEGLVGPCAWLIHVSFSLFMRFRPRWFIHDEMCLLLLCSSDCAHHPPAPLLPTDLEALGLLPVPRHHHCHISGGLIRLRGDWGELLLHPQHLAHAHRRERRLPSSTTCQTRRESHSPEAAARLRLPALCERARGDGTGGPSDHYHQQHMHQLMMFDGV